MLISVVVSLLTWVTSEGRVLKSPEWISSGSTSLASRGLEFCEHNVENTAIALSQRLGAWEGCLGLPRDHGPSLPRNEGCVLGQVRVAGFPLFAVFAVSGRSSGGRVSGLGAWEVNRRSK